MGGSLLKIENITKRRGSGFALEIPRLELRAGKVYGMVGPNGAGKSTLLRILNLLEEPDEGDIFLFGEKVTPSNALNNRRRMVMVMENPYLFHSKVFNNVASGLKFRSIDRDRWAPMVKEALGLVGLVGFESRYAPELSRGESQRVAIARALALRPEILLLDEPFTNIDSRNAAVLEEMIKGINGKHGTTVVFTTHDLSQACRLADEVVPIIDGRVVKGSLENLFSGNVLEAEGSQFVRISMNVLVSVATEKRGKVHLCIPPSDIIISMMPLESSARNCFEGVIRRIHMEGEVVRVFVGVDAGTEMVALITKKSYDAMNLSTDSRAFLTFKSTAVEVF